MNYTHMNRGTCSRAVSFDINDGIVTNIQFVGGCNGNTQGVAALAEGMKAEDIIAKCEGIDCNRRGTSCPDQLAKAVKEAISK